MFQNWAVMFVLTLCGIDVVKPFPNIIQKPDNSSDNRIVGGEIAQPGQFPYQISIRANDNNSHYCGGSILNHNWILTAAHCVKNNMRIVVGTIYKNSGGISYDINRKLTRQGYDIALLRTRNPIVFNQFVQPINLIKYMPKSGTKMYLTGWGNTQKNNETEALQYLITDFLTTEDCRKDEKFVAEDEVCSYAGYGRGQCIGDAGGPLVTVDNDQVGISSFLFYDDWNMCGLGHPDGFTSTFFHRDWILNNIND